MTPSSINKLAENPALPGSTRCSHPDLNPPITSPGPRSVSGTNRVHQSSRTFDQDLERLNWGSRTLCNSWRNLQKIRFGSQKIRSSFDPTSTLFPSLRPYLYSLPFASSSSNLPTRPFQRKEGRKEGKISRGKRPRIWPQLTSTPDLNPPITSPGPRSVSGPNLVSIRPRVWTPIANRQTDRQTDGRFYRYR